MSRGVYLVALPDVQKDRLRCFANALANWKYEGYVVFKKRAQQWLRDELSSYSADEIRRLLHEFVVNGGAGVIDEQPETRREYVSYEFHYDLRVHIDNRLIYFESILLCDDPNDPDDPRIVVVSIHDA